MNNFDTIAESLDELGEKELAEQVDRLRTAAASRRLRRELDQLRFIFRRWLVITQKCYFCHKTFGKGHPVKHVTVHHINFDHFDDSEHNVVLAHRFCHRSYHMQKARREGITFETAPSWLGYCAEEYDEDTLEYYKCLKAKK